MRVWIQIDFLRPIGGPDYDEETNQFIIIFEQTKVDEKINELSREKNYYINSIYITEENNDSKVIVDLKDSANYFTAQVERLEDAGPPFVDFSFMSKVGGK